MQFQTVSEIETKIQSMLRSTIRNGIGTICLAKHLNARLMALGLPERETNLNIVIDTGIQCTLAGSGKCYEKFKNTGTITSFTGCGQKPALSKDSHYSQAPLRLMTFVDMYGNSKYKESKQISLISSNTFTFKMQRKHCSVIQLQFWLNFQMFCIYQKLMMQMILNVRKNVSVMISVQFTQFSHQFC